MKRVALVLIFWLLASACHAAASDPGSNQWIALRVNLWAKTCLAAVPGFENTATAARRLGFKRDSNGFFVYRKTDFVMSLEEKNGKCSCYVTFGTTQPKVAADKIRQKLLGLGDRFQATPSPKTIGTIATADGLMTVVVLKAKLKKSDWMAVRIFGQKPCP
jgi:hypothetical protein